MTAPYPLAEVAALMGEPTRAAMLIALLDGRSLTAGELARVADLTASATSLHLAKLTRGGLLEVHKAGRHRYYRLARVEVAHALEALGVISTGSPPPRSLSAKQMELREARTCYDHLAGVIAVDLTTRLEQRAMLRVRRDGRYYDVTSAGTRWFTDALQIDVAALARGRRPLARRCLDWTERRPHLSGSLGAALLERLMERRWVARTKSARALRLTTAGRAALDKLAT